MGSVEDARYGRVVEELVRAFRDAVLRPGEESYEEENGKFWNRDNAEVRPAAIVTPSNAQEAACVFSSLAIPTVSEYRY